MTYKIICADSLSWLSEKENGSLGSFITGLPDMNEVSMNLEDYIIFFRKCAKLIFDKMSKKGYAIFIQTDRKADGIWFDKSYHLTNVAYECNVKLMWHKIVLQRDVGHCYLQRPTYSHILCYSYMNKPGKCFTDVLPVGIKEYENATPQNASEATAEFLSHFNDIKQTIIYDPFVGRGTTGLSVIKRGMNFIGIDIDKKQCEICEEYLRSYIPFNTNIELNTEINVTNNSKLKFKFK